MAKYRKLIVAVVGIGVLLAKDFFGATLPEGVEQQAVSIIDILIGVLTSLGIWAVPNATT